MALSLAAAVLAGAGLAGAAALGGEIGEMIALDARDDRARARELAQARVAAIDSKIAELQEARDALAGLASDCARKKGGACPILKAFDPK